METGTIPIENCPGGFDLYLTLESGQSYLWRREDGQMYAGDGTDTASSDDHGRWYSTVVDGDVIRVRRRRASTAGATDGVLEWEATSDREATIRRLLRLEDDLEAIVDSTPDDPLLEKAYDAYRGLRLVEDPPFGTLISFICSAQMRVGRIHDMVSTLARTYGDAVAFDGETYHAFPRPDQLAAATESELRDLGLGYRAPYVVRTAEMVASGEARPEAARDLEYEDAREYLTRFVGVGDKVADCILLFALGFDEAVPLDTWIKTAIADYYPDCDRGNYAETSRAIRERFGGEYAGYAQTYVFHYLRTGQ
ncbi:8-oxoguanine DNA glycosylase [Halostagnicola sp. A56]|uniref:DNA-3-methyladenine glycosylase family protein n=1 Tax=Halostagnicola sp. A56 TaxID=1495067 RepID=UPI0004A149B4|nr:DNA-3-methyladenine glycosylase [Halostagnicola sp. A56]KDE59443.1 8-oxoguanine DNA glycosylase [Halostagnicola sp. A56]